MCNSTNTVTLSLERYENMKDRLEQLEELCASRVTLAVHYNNNGEYGVQYESLDKSIKDIVERIKLFEQLNQDLRSELKSVRGYFDLFKSMTKREFVKWKKDNA